MRVLSFVPRALLILWLFLLAACSDDDNSPGSTPTPEAPSGTETATPQPEATATEEPTATSAAATETATRDDQRGQIGPAAVIDPFEIISRMIDECENIDAVECMNGIVQDAEISADAKAFWLEYEAFLVDFEEHGAVDYGAVSSPRFNMARPSPVFLNGDFRLTYVGEVPPEGWEMLPEYEGLPEFATAWVEYSSLVDATAEGGSQVFAIEMPIQECRACQAIGYLNLEVNFQGGGLGEVTVLPMTETPAGP